MLVSYTSESGRKWWERGAWEEKGLNMLANVEPGCSTVDCDQYLGYSI